MAKEKDKPDKKPKASLKDWWKKKLGWQEVDDYEVEWAGREFYDDYSYGAGALPEHTGPPGPGAPGSHLPVKYTGYQPPVYDPKVSYSSKWKDRLGGWWSSWEAGYRSYGEYSETLRMLEHATRQLARTANVLRNAKTGEERALYLKWGGQTQPDNNEIALNPDALKTAKPEERDIVIDGMSGYVMLGSTMKRTIDPVAWHGYTNDKAEKNNVGQIAAPMWESLETAVARKEVLSEWGGFLPYFARHAEKTGATKPMVEFFLRMNKPNAQGAAAIVAWNMLNPKDCIMPSKDYEDVVNEAIQCIADGEEDPAYRYANCRAAARLILDKLPPDPSPKSDPEGDGEEGGGEGDGSDGAGKPKGDPSKRPQITDKDLFGSPVTPTKVKSEELPDSLNMTEFDPFDVVMPKGCPKLNSLPEHRVLTTDDGREYNKLIREMAPQISRIKEALWFRNSERAQWSRGQLSGDLDEGGLHKLSIPEPQPTIWERRDIVSMPRIAVCLLVDESGSMRGMGESRGGSIPKYIAARRVAVAITEALRQIKGVHALIMGHTANSCGGRQQGDGIKTQVLRESKDNCVLLREFYGPSHANPYACAAIGSYDNNLDGYAMEHTARRLSKVYDKIPLKLMFVISDGMPAGEIIGIENQRQPYGDTEAMEHMQRVCQWARSVPKVQIYGIGVCNAYSKESGAKMYGNGRFVIIKDVESSLLILTSFLRNIALKMEVQQEG